MSSLILKAMKDWRRITPKQRLCSTADPKQLDWICSVQVLLYSLFWLINWPSHQANRKPFQLIKACNDWHGIIESNDEYSSRAWPQSSIKMQCLDPTSRQYARERSLPKHIEDVIRTAAGSSHVRRQVSASKRHHHICECAELAWNRCIRIVSVATTTSLNRHRIPHFHRWCWIAAATSLKTLRQRPASGIK